MSQKIIAIVVLTLILVIGSLILLVKFGDSPEKMVVSVTILVIIWTLSLVIPYKLLHNTNTGTNSNTKYSCVNGKCVKDKKGKYTLRECKKICSPSPGNAPATKNTVLNVDYLTIEYNPNDYSVTDTISPWFNESITKMKKGDVAVFMTDYMIIHSTILENMKTAISNGAKFILGADRWYICGKPYDCGGDNTCPDCTRTPKPDNCNCNIPQANGCASFNSILDSLDYCNNKNNIILIDQPSVPSNEENNSLWGHAHRKIVNFYYKSSNNARLISGSWNIDADLNRGSLGVKETSLGIETDLNDSFAQYMLQMDIDTITPIITYVPSVAAVSSDVLPLLNSLKSIKGYPKLPIISTVNWSDSTPGYSKSSGTDKNVEIWLGISPPAVDAANKFVSPKSVVYGNNSLPGGDGKWQTQYNEMVQKSSLCVKNGTGDNGDGTFADFCKDKNGKIKTLDFAKGGTWAGLLFQKFFDSSSKSPFINISMYVGFDIGDAPCNYLEGGWGTCDGDYHSPGWFQHQFPLLFPAIREYLANATSSLRILTGEYNSSNNEDWNPWIWNNAFPSLPKDKQERIHWRWFNQGPDGKPVLGCQNSCGPNGCCRNHEKLYISDQNILVSSGHPERGYYSDINGINNDILFLKSKGLAGVFNTHYKTQWQKQGVSINSETDRKQACTAKDGTCWIPDNKSWNVFTGPVKW